MIGGIAGFPILSALKHFTESLVRKWSNEASWIAQRNEQLGLGFKLEQSVSSGKQAINFTCVK
jgi:hypothetical protein